MSKRRSGGNNRSYLCYQVGTTPSTEVKRFCSSKRSSRSGNQCDFKMSNCLDLFKEYTDEDPEVMGPEGMVRFCEDLGVDPTDLAMLVLAWKMNAKQMGYFTKKEWVDGLIALECDTITKLRARLDYLRSLLNDAPTFKNIYRYAFDFTKDKDQRSMDVDTAKAMMKLLLADKWRLFPSFMNFIEVSNYKIINKDQWSNILEFVRSINDNLSSYDVDGAWPVILDEFVEWLKKNPTHNDVAMEDCASTSTSTL